MAEQPNQTSGQPNIEEMRQQIAMIQNAIQGMQENFAKQEFSVESSNGLVTIKANGAKHVISIKINPDKIDEDDPELLEDMILTATNKLFKDIDDSFELEMNKITRQFGIS